MEALSQKKKIGIIAGAILLLTVVALVSTGRMSLTGLSSSAITSPTYVCSEQNQARNLAQYNQIPNNITNANNKISIISGEIKVLQDKINAHNTTIAQKQAQITTRPAEIARLNGLIAPLTTFINTKCSKPTGSMVRTCNDKKKEKLKYGNEITKLNNLENDITKLRNEIGTPENSKSLKGKIQLKENQIGIWQGKIAGYELSKKQYERCALELKTKPTVFSGAMSGEIKLISGEIQPGTEKLVSGEVMFFTGTVIAPLVSGEVTISGEVGQSTLLTVVTNKMEFSVKPSPENNFDIKNWFLEFEQYARTKCSEKQVSSNPVEIKITCNLPAKNTPPIIISAGTVGNFKLIGKLGSIAMPLAVETNFVSLQYNGSRTDIDKQTAPSNLRYEKPPVADVYFRYASWACHNGEKINEGGTSSCKPQTLWKQYAETFCQNKCSPETGKCGVNSYSNSEQCISSVCGNGIKEGAEQCDDGNTTNGDGCDSLCKSEMVNRCNDSDGGENIFKYGEAVIGEQKVQDQCNLKVFNGYNDQYNLVKSCTGSNCVVLEAICDQYSTNDGFAEYARSKIVSCPNGCNDGACITNSQTGLEKYSVGAPTAVFVNEAFDVSIKALRADESLLDKYEGTIQFDFDSTDANVTLPTTSGQYKFTLADKGAHTFQKGFKINTAGTYKFAVMSTESNIPPTFFTVVAINKTGGTSCTDTDGGLIENTKGTVSGIAWYGEPYTYTDVCNKDAAGKESVSEAYCYAYPEGGAKVYWSAQYKDCPNGCNDGACKPADPVAEVCEDLAITPSTIQGGGTVNYTCQASNDILCVLDPQYCKPKTYSVVIKKPDGGIVQTSTTATGSITIPSSPAGTYTAECFVNGQTTTIAACKKTITNNTPAATLNVTGLNTQLSTPAKYIISPNGIGATDAMKAVFNVTSTGGTSTITELTFTMSGGDSNAVTMVKVGNVSSAVVNNVATLYGLNIPISEGSTQQITAQLSYSGVGEGGIKTGTNSGTTLSQVKYSAGSSISTITPNVSSKVMILTGSIPYVSTPGPSFTQFGLVLGSQNKIGEVTIAADVKGSIRINTIGFVSEYFGPDNSISLPIRITDGTNTITGSNCYFEVGGATGVGYGSKIIVCDLGTNNKLDHDGYEIPAGASKTFSLYTTINGNTIQTKVDETIFNWEDTTYSGTEGSYANGWLLPNFPSQNQYNRAT